MRRPAALVAMIVSFTASACGGGGGGTSVHTVTLHATPELTGSVSASGEFLVTDTEPVAGDLLLTAEEGIRGFISFDISSIPPTATVTSAWLRLTILGAGSGVADLYLLVIDHVVYGDVLDVGAYDRSFPNQEFGVVWAGVPIPYSDLLITDLVQSDLASMHSRSQFRMRFQIGTNNNGASDLVVTGAPSSPDAPRLIVEYR